MKKMSSADRRSAPARTAEAFFMCLKKKDSEKEDPRTHPETKRKKKKDRRVSKKPGF